MKPKKFDWRNYRQAFILLYGLVYLAWFFWLEQNITTFHVIHSPLDDLIPFCEYFIIPYLLWFGYVAAAFVYFLFFQPKKEFYRLSIYLFTGMTLFLIICTIWPNGLQLRPEYDPAKNIFTRLIAYLHQVDTATNVFPSIHVYNSAVVHICFSECDVSKRHKWVRPVSFLLSTSIILSTVFLKQHSVIDVVGGLVMAALLYPFFFRKEISANLTEGKTKWNAFKKEFIKSHF